MYGHHNRARLPILLVVSCSRLRIWSCETGLAVPSRVSLLISILRLNLVFAYGVPSEFRGGVYSLSVHKMYYECSNTYMYTFYVR